MNFVAAGKSIRWPLVLGVSFALFGSSVIGWAEAAKTAAFLAYTQRRYPDALSLYMAINDRSGTGMTLLAMNRPDEARNAFRDAGDRSGMGLAALAKHDTETAEAEFGAAGDFRGLGLTHLNRHDIAAARAAFAQANDWSGLGLAALAEQQYAEAKQHFEKAGDRSGLGLTALKQKQWDEAREQFEAGNDIAGLGLLALAQRNYPKAKEHFNTVNDLSGLGRVAMAEGKLKLAETYFAQANDFDGLGDLFSMRHQFAQARDAFERDGNAVKVLQSYRNDYRLADRLDQALAYGQQAAAEGRQSAECKAEMADVLYELKRPQQALALLDEVQREPGFESLARLRKGRILFYLRDYRRAKGELEQVKADTAAGPGVYRHAQTTLETLERYRRLPEGALQPAESF